MEWSTIVGTIVGAVVGLISVFLADHLRWRREDKNQWLQARQQVYVDFLAALSKAHSEMRSVVFRGELSDVERRHALLAATDASGVWRLRQSISLIGSRQLMHEVVAAAQKLEGVCEALSLDPDVSSDRYIEARNNLWAANAALRESMRKDLGIAGDPDPDLHTYRPLGN
ncbi:hypothetical protein E1193_15225 [Micromonospora sp. KC606]|uniref:hypothetical protein n=1 Tax=Micromonospora sp. KC606 TaxID=2530379 RepID=UPI0010476F0D|nr:hypothetical protein [Micromonospora sp. KC606]TDC81263.1 hypothetical protein E1193_15225 [Micromonospora sp. KC606]